MTRSQRIKKIVNLSEKKERDAAREFATVQKILAEYKDRLKQLESYRQEYTIQLKPGGEVQSASMMRERQAFIIQIDEGIRLLKNQIQIQEAMNNRERENWLKQKQQLDTMENIFQRFHKTEQQMMILREQNQLDELSQRQVKR
ncbi:MAG: flagellar export protein FliJ [Proteobacteria bacterium]|nr:flagellar export protein FliJ [Pseudomonadota bacterium]NOG58941.1 flagellar export protein FliJ [Pseudomonadota bacterium]